MNGEKLENTLIYDNEASSDGGGISTAIDRTILNSSIIYRNKSGSGRYGPAIYIQKPNADTLLIMNSIVAENLRGEESSNIRFFEAVVNIGFTTQ